MTTDSCDDGNTMREDGCNEYCWLEMGWICPELGMPCYYDDYPVCGDGVVSGNESCDDGINDGTYGTCAPGCVLAPHCGDGYIQPEFGEECDPGWVYSIFNWDCTFLEGEGCYYFDMALHFGETIQNDAGEYCTCIEEGEVTCYVVDPII